MLVDRWFHSSPVSDVLRGTPAFPTFSFFWPRNLRFGRLFVANFTNTRRKNLSIKIVPSFSSDTNPLSISIVPFVTKKMAKETFKNATLIVAFVAGNYHFTVFNSNYETRFTL